MSDFTELFTPASDPKHLTWSAFVQKEETNLAHAISGLPSFIQGFVQSSVTSLGALASAVEGAGGNALGGIISQELPALEAWFAGVLGKAGAQAATPTGNAAIQTIGTSAVAVIQHMTTQAQAGTLQITGSTPPAA